MGRVDKTEFVFVFQTCIRGYGFLLLRPKNLCCYFKTIKGILCIFFLFYYFCIGRLCKYITLNVQEDPRNFWRNIRLLNADVELGIKI